MPGHSRKRGQHTPHAPIGDVRDPESLYHYLQRFLAWLAERQYSPKTIVICHTQVRIIAFINDAGTVKKTLDHICESTQPRRISPARGPPLWEAAAAAEQAQNDPQ